MGLNHFPCDLYWSHGEDLQKKLLGYLLCSALAKSLTELNFAPSQKD